MCDKGGSKKNDKPCWNRQKFVDHYIHTEEFIDHDILLDQVKEDGIAIAEAERFLKAAIKRGDVLTTHKGKDLLYSRGDVTSPNANTGTDSTMTKKDQIIIYLKAFPEAINSDVAIKCDCSEKYVRTIRSELSKRSI